jgi:hypothetical protein
LILKNIKEEIVMERIVTICLPDSNFNGKQGKVVGKDPKTKELLVILGPKDEYLLGHCSAEEEKQIRFKEAELRTDDEWLPENKAILLFGRSMWHTIQTLKKKFVPGGECMHKGCLETTIKRIMVNVWGCVAEFDVCAKHAKEYHGKCIDCFSNKPA